jgi:protease-4
MNATPTPENQSAQWEQDLIKRFAFEALQEQRRARRWSIFFKLLLLMYLLGALLIGAGLGKGFGKGELGGPSSITAAVDVKGVIAPDMPASAANIIEGLRAAFEDKRTAAVLLRINSPGGSPVQSGLINDEIFRLKHKYPSIKVYAAVEDICASGAYYVASAADEIYADKGSLVGSIGVRMDGFGFVDALSKLGVERRLLTAGEHKAFLDPFSPVKPDEKKFVEGLLGEIHQQFINTVKKGRQERLKSEVDLFNGLIWTGERGLELGLVDALGSADFVAREIVRAEDLVDFTPHENALAQLGRRFGAQIGASIRQSLATQW